MGHFVGVLASYEFGRVPMKRLALMFHQVALPWAETERERVREGWNFFGRRGTLIPGGDLEWLMDQGIVIDPYVKLKNSVASDAVEKQLVEKIKQLEQQFHELKNAYRHLTDDNKPRGRFIKEIRLSKGEVMKLVALEIPEAQMPMIILAELKKDYQKIQLSMELKGLLQMDAFPITSPFIFLPPANPTALADVLQMALLKIPIPDESTPWEHIIEYRSDPDTQAKFFDLREWMNEVARAKLTPLEIEQKLEYLLSRYQRHIQLHKMKVNTGTLETCVTVGAEFLEGLLHVKPSRVAKALFSLKHRKIALLEAELTAPGNEVAYIIKAQDTFK